MGEDGGTGEGDGVPRGVRKIKSDFFFFLCVVFVNFFLLWLRSTYFQSSLTPSSLIPYPCMFDRYRKDKQEIQEIIRQNQSQSLGGNTTGGSPTATTVASPTAPIDSKV